MRIETVVFFGADGGCLDAINLANETFEIEKSIVLSDKPIDINYQNLEHYGGFDKHPASQGKHFVHQCGNSSNFRRRGLLFNKARNNGLIPLSCISRDAYIHHSSKIGQGSVIYPGVKIMGNVTIGENVIILPNAVVNHDCVIGDYSIINSGSILNGSVILGDNCYVGSGANIKEEVTICDKALIGMGSLVLKNIEEIGLFYGTPARQIK